MRGVKLTKKNELNFKPVASRHIPLTVIKCIPAFSGDEFVSEKFSWGKCLILRETESKIIHYFPALI